MAGASRAGQGRRRLVRLNRRLEHLCMAVSGLAAAGMTLVAFVDCIGRKLDHPLPGASEMVTFALMLFFFSAIPLVVKSDSHIRVGLLSDFYGPRLSRAEKAVTSVLEAAAMIVFAWMIFDQAGRLERFGTATVFFEAPVAPWVYVAAGFSALAVWFALQPLFGIAPDPAAGDGTSKIEDQ